MKQQVPGGNCMMRAFIMLKSTRMNTVCSTYGREIRMKYENLKESDH
jgi:hypothetical protein